MLAKVENLRRIADRGLIAVVRAPGIEAALATAEALKTGGIDIIEITLTVPGALEVIKALTQKYRPTDVLVGAGTVLDPETARLAVLAGAEFIVSPHLDERIIRLAHRYQKLCLPGAMTATEVVAALEAGADIVKFFPGDSLGPKAVKAILGPLPYAPICPTGGVSLNNVAQWFAAGVVAVGVGGELTREAIAKGDYSLATDAARRFTAAVGAARNK
ncbi:MAG: bifunctional 2-keto-4-hydroxyglutarate aldolase/2-keto-3-deoxy-6-phosphogluconate aldolase [bacterium]|jgi:2-dehydro-3-deoxyphosphogluconate aldolase/(4S)-4-hydroxy-2-oxoglutarate aldolase